MLFVPSRENSSPRFAANVTIDWTVRDNVRAQLSVLVKRIFANTRIYPFKPSNGCVRVNLVLTKRTRTNAAPSTWTGLYKASWAIPGGKVRIAADIRKTVVFLGVEDASRDDEFRPVGTAFLLAYDGARYLVTVKHVALGIGDAPFLIRVNHTDGGAGNLLMEEDTLRWFTHSDASVDLAIAPFQYDLKSLGLDTLLIGTMEDKWLIQPTGFECGDFCYTVGLFQFMSGKKRNLPVVHSGNIALLPSDELIPVRDWDNVGRGTKHVEGYLVQSESVQGLSGAPVFARHVIEFSGLPTADGGKIDALLMQKNLALLGVWQGAWDAPPDEVRALSLGQGGVRVPVGMGVVVPASKMAEILEMPEAKEAREELKNLQEQEKAAGLDSIPLPAAAPAPAAALPDPHATGANHTQREDFARPVGAAARKPARED
jgi:hypothetical protein